MWRIWLIAFSLVGAGAMFACSVPVGSGGAVQGDLTGAAGLHTAQCSNCGSGTGTSTGTGTGTSTSSGGGGGGASVTSGCYANSPYGSLCSALGNRVGVLSGVTCASLLGYNWSAEYAQNTWIPSLPYVSATEITAMQNATEQSAQAYGASAATQAAWSCSSLAATLSSYDPEGIVAGNLVCSNGQSQWASHTYLASALPTQQQAVADVAAFANSDVNPAALVCPEGGFAILNDPPPIHE